jgi:ferritin heavy chain
MFMEYKAERGVRVVFSRTSPKPVTMEKGSALEAIDAVLEPWKMVNQSLLDLHKVAGDKGNAHLCDYLESEFLNEQVESIKKVSDVITKLKRAGPGLSEHIIDKELSS